MTLTLLNAVLLILAVVQSVSHLISSPQQQPIIHPLHLKLQHYMTSSTPTLTYHLLTWIMWSAALNWVPTSTCFPVTRPSYHNTCTHLNLSLLMTPVCKPPTSNTWVNLGSFPLGSSFLSCTWWRRQSNCFSTQGNEKSTGHFFDLFFCWQQVFRKFVGFP